LGVRHEILIVTQAADPETATWPSDGREGLVQEESGYGGALLRPFRIARELTFSRWTRISRHRPSASRTFGRGERLREIVIASAM